MHLPRKKKKILTWCLNIAAVISFTGCDSDSNGSNFSLADRELANTILDNGVLTIADESQDENLVELGRALFFDRELSGNRDVSCATCHHPSIATVDGISLSVGVGGEGLGPDRLIPLDDFGNPVFIPRNAPDIFNRGLVHTMFADGRVSEDEFGNLTTPAGEDLLPGLSGLVAAQAMFPVTSRAEMRGEVGESELGNIDDADFIGIWDALIDRLLAIEEYRTLFALAFPYIPEEELTFAHAANAIAAFELQNWTLSRDGLDRFLEGNGDALTEQQKEGARLFFGQASCFVCHNGPLLTDELFHNTGVPQIGPGKGDGEFGENDFGRERVTGELGDRYRFKTPPLRNVAETGPWMHSGAFTDLRDVVARYNDIPASANNYDPDQLEANVRTTYRPEQTPDILGTLDSQLPDINLSDTEIDAITAFLNALTAPGIANLVENDIPDSVPSGLPID